MKVRATSIAQFAVFCLLIGTAGCARTAMRQSLRFDEWRRSGAEVAVVPPDVMIEEVGVLGRTRLPQEDGQVAAAAPAVAEQVLRAAGLLVREGALCRPATGDGGACDAEVTQGRRSFGAIEAQLWGSNAMIPEKEALAYRAGLAPPPAALSSCAGVAALVFIDVRGWRKSAARVTAEMTGEVALAVLTLGNSKGTGSDPYGETTASIAIVEAATGEVLWANRVTRSRGMLVGKPEDAVAACLEPLSQNGKTPGLKEILFGRR